MLFWLSRTIYKTIKVLITNIVIINSRIASMQLKRFKRADDSAHGFLTLPFSP